MNSERGIYSASHLATQHGSGINSALQKNRVWRLRGGLMSIDSAGGFFAREPTHSLPAACGPRLSPMRKPSLLIIFLTVFMDLIGFGIVLPLLPRYSEKFGAGGFLIGLIIASFSVMQFLLSPAWGRWSDRIGRRPVLLISNFGSVVSYGMFALSAWPGFSPAAAVAILLASRVFAGACGANLSVASAYIADITPPDKRSKSMGLIGVAFGLGFILGPALGAFSAKHLGLAGPGAVAAALCAVNFTLACFILAESRQPGSGHAGDRPKLTQWGHILRQRHVGLLVGLYTLSTFSFACYESTLPLLLGSPLFHPNDFQNVRALAAKLEEGGDPVSKRLQVTLPPEFRRAVADPNTTDQQLRKLFFHEFNRQIKSASLLDEAARQAIRQRPETQAAAAKEARGDAIKRLNRLLLEDAYPDEIGRQKIYYDEQRIGYLFAYCGLISVLIQGGVIGRLVKRFGEHRVILGSLVIIAGSLVLIPYVETLAGLLFALGAFSAGAGINRAPTMGLISVYANPAEQGATMGVAQSAGTLARIVAPILATTFYALSPHSPYLFAAAVAGFAALIAWRYLRPEPSAAETREK
jgi:MFS family permease